ncbi:hypothetical protein [Frankia tisae]|uniref:hypothetical protein n=1 Tax=Frankia tisae TaxID=2950104 RepID=UPI0021BF6C54|nr:hypothetical protein [Frankia tisae]
MTTDLDSPRAPWRGPRSPASWRCPRCQTAAAADPDHPDALVVEHRPGCRTPTGLEAAHTTATASTSR